MVLIIILYTLSIFRNSCILQWRILEVVNFSDPNFRICLKDRVIAEFVAVLGLLNIILKTYAIFVFISEGVWYRALCINSQPNSKIEVQLIDDGRIVPVWHTNIRKMIPEVSHYVATALFCTIRGEIIHYIYVASSAVVKFKDLLEK